MSNKNLDECVRTSLEAYFRDLDGIDPHGMHDMLVRAVEKPLLEVVMAPSRQQPVQSRAVAWTEPQYPAQKTS